MDIRRRISLSVPDSSMAEQAIKKMWRVTGDVSFVNKPRAIMPFEQVNHPDPSSSSSSSSTCLNRASSIVIWGRGNPKKIGYVTCVKEVRYD